MPVLLWIALRTLPSELFGASIVSSPSRELTRGCTAGNSSGVFVRSGAGPGGPYGTVLRVASLSPFASFSAFADLWRAGGAAGFAPGSVWPGAIAVSNSGMPQNVIRKRNMDFGPQADSSLLIMILLLMLERGCRQVLLPIINLMPARSGGP